MLVMDKNSGQDKGRQAAAEIAREKVMAAYRIGGKTQFSGMGEAGIRATGQTGTYKKAPVRQTGGEDLQKYHTAWQDYYQRYYSSYYARAAKQYVDREKLKQERLKNDLGEDLGDGVGAVRINKNEVELNLREKVKVLAERKVKKKKKYKILGPVMAGVVVFGSILFLQYNRLIFAPIMAYVSPTKEVETELVGIDPMVSRPPGKEPKLIIPKLNIDVPVHFGIASDEGTVMNAMNHGVAQFMIPGASAMPGQKGNLVITGHSAGDIYSNNQYKFIFSGLERLRKGDKMYIHYQGKRYVYVMWSSKIVWPDNVAALKVKTETPQLVLVTCTPLGTSKQRLLIYAEQVHPVVGKDSGISGGESGNEEKINENGQMPANEKSFFEKIGDFLFRR